MSTPRTPGEFASRIVAVLIAVAYAGLAFTVLLLPRRSEAFT